MKQNEVEWVEYESTINDIIQISKLPRRIFFDLRGNHDSFGVPAPGDDYDFYQKYSINAKLRRQGRVHSITLEVSGLLCMIETYLLQQERCGASYFTAAS
jgi:hypothetical protein